MSKDEPKKVTVFVIEQHKGGKTLKCSMKADGEQSFFLPKSQIEPIGKVFQRQFAEFIIPEWLYLSHRQICGDAAYDAEKKRRADFDRIKP